MIHMTGPDKALQTIEQPDTPRRAYKRYLISVLMVVLAFNYVDRQAFAIVLEDIKADLALSDTQLGVLGGIAFAFFYAAMGIPIARWSDRGNRIAIIATTTSLWSIAVALCGAATSFAQLFAIRAAVAVGESGCIPPAHSLIADEFQPQERPRAVSRYMLGLPLSLIIGYFGAGWLNQYLGWRLTFLAIGAPGLIAALFVAVTLKEPRRQKPPPKSLPLRVVFKTLWSKTAFRHLLLCYAVWYFFGWGLQQWQPTFLVRSFGMQTSEIGLWLALIYGIGGAVGIYLGGELAVRYAANNSRLQLTVCALAFAIFSIFNALAYIAPTPSLVLGALAVAGVGGNMGQGPLLAAMQSLVPQSMRAMSIAVVFFFANLIGAGFGPVAAGALSDLMALSAGANSLRYALLILCPGYLWAAWHAWRAGQTILRETADPSPLMSVTEV